MENNAKKQIHVDVYTSFLFLKRCDSIAKRGKREAKEQNKCPYEDYAQDIKSNTKTMLRT